MGFHYIRTNCFQDADNLKYNPELAHRGNIWEFLVCARYDLCVTRFPISCHSRYNSTRFYQSVDLNDKSLLLSSADNDSDAYTGEEQDWKTIKHSTKSFYTKYDSMIVHQYIFRECGMYGMCVYVFRDRMGFSASKPPPVPSQILCTDFTLWVIFLP